MQAQRNETRVFEATESHAVFPLGHSYDTGEPRIVFDDADGERIYVTFQTVSYVEGGAEAHFRRLIGQAAQQMDRPARMRLAESLLSVMPPEDRAAVVNAVTERWHSPGIKGTA